MSSSNDFGVAHPDRATLEAFAAGRLEDERFSSVASHLEACEDCGRLVDAFSLRQDPLWANIADLLSPESSDTELRADPSTARTVVLPANTYPSGGDTLPVTGQGAGSSSVQGKGQPFGNYLLLAEVARGGMGVVYKAQQLKLKRLVALKMIKSGQLADDDAIKRFYTEAEAAARLNHPGIVPIYEVGQHEDRHFFSMAFVEGESLEKRISGTPLPAREAAILMQAIAEAIAYAHSQGVIHRDLKPANVLLDEQGHPKVADFGLAKNLQADSGLTQTGMIMGTPSYMSPEQALGNSTAIGAKSDIYSLGAILYCMLTGRPPFRAANPVDTLRHVIDQEPAAPRQLNPETPLDLETLCLKCLSKDPAQRYATANELALELGRYLRGEPISARPIGTLARRWRWCSRNPAAASLSAIVALILVAFVCLNLGRLLLPANSFAAIRTSIRALYGGMLLGCLCGVLLGGTTLPFRFRQMTSLEDVGRHILAGLLIGCLGGIVLLFVWSEFRVWVISYIEQLEGIPR